MRKIFCISGLGADHSVFDRVKIPGYQLVPVPWLPVESNESLDTYAHRMRQQIPESKPIILGLSFGGVVAQTMAQHAPTDQLLLLSTMRKPTGLRRNLLRFKNLPFYQWLPNFLLRWLLHHNTWVFGPLSKRNRSGLQKMLNQFPPNFYKWAFHQILHWKGIENATVKTTHIHGSKDWLFPIEQAHADFVVMDAGHLMVLTHAKRVSGLLQAALPPQPSVIFDAAHKSS